MSINTVTVVGNLTRDAEIRAVGETTVARFGLALNEVYKDRQGVKQEKTHFIDCEVWGPVTRVLEQYTRKGDRLGVTGSLQQENWETKEGEKRSKISIRVKDLQLLSPKPADRQDAPRRQPPPVPPKDEDIPF